MAFGQDGEGFWPGQVTWPVPENKVSSSDFLIDVWVPFTSGIQTRRRQIVINNKYVRNFSFETP